MSACLKALLMRWNGSGRITVSQPVSHHLCTNAYGAKAVLGAAAAIVAAIHPAGRQN
jgi:hypothetical protein